MTKQLEVANRHREYHASDFGYARPNVELIEGDIERLDATGLRVLKGLSPAADAVQRAGSSGCIAAKSARFPGGPLTRCF